MTNSSPPRNPIRATIVYDDVTAEPLNDPQFWAKAEVRAFVSVPLVRDEELRATLFVACRSVRIWPPEDVALIEDVARRTWDALQRARAEAALREANGTLKRLLAEHTAALRANEARLRTIFETSFQLQGLLAPDGTLLEANATSLAAIKCQLNDVVGKPFWETPWFTGTPRMSERAHAAVQAAMRGESARQEIMLQLPSGMRSYDLSLRPIRDEVGAVVAIVPEAVDITDRRQAEDALRQAQKMEAIGQLTGGIAHDFNNLLQGITGSLELMRIRAVKGDAEEFDRYIEIAMGSANRAAVLTHRLLAFSRRQTLDPKPTDLNRLVAGMKDLLHSTLAPNIRLQTSLTAEPWITLCDPHQLENALLNLVVNARDAMPDGGHLLIETTNTVLRDRRGRVREHPPQDVPPGEYVALSVADTGTGMTREVIARAFEPFFTTKPLGQGTGLGLSMIYGFVQQSGGHVRLHSEVGQGTTATIYLPRQPEGVVDVLEKETVVNTLTIATTGVVLLVEDEADVRTVVRDILSDLGYAVLEAGNGQAGLSIVASEARIDLLLTDIGLPGGINGRQLADAARRCRPGLKVLFITGYAENMITDNRPMEEGMQVMTKPFRLTTLVSRVREIISG